MEFCSGGNLKELLSNSKINDEYKNIYCKFTERQLINFAAEIARGMQFLFENKVILSNLYQWYTFSRRFACGQHALPLYFSKLQYFNNLVWAFGQNILSTYV